MTVNMKTPPQVTRFYGTIDYAIDVTKNMQIAFVHASKLNDPFDPYCFFETDFGDSYSNLVEFVKEHHRSDLSWFREHVTSQSWGQTVCDLRRYLREVRDAAFVLSTSAGSFDQHPKDNLYMWGHYANGHHGLAIEFDTRALASAVKEDHEAKTGKPLEESDVWTKIEYARTFSPITAGHVYEFMKQHHEQLRRKTTVTSVTKLEVYYNRMNTIKSDVWKGENEWRLNWRNPDTKEKVHMCPIGNDAVVSIFLGLNLETGRSEELIAAARQNFPAASLYRARKRHGDLALEFNEV
jgi:hypothetical protein